MTMEQQRSDLKESLTEMGYKDADVESAIAAGVKEVWQAVDYIRGLQLPPEDTPMNFPSLSNAKVTASSTSSHPSQNTGTQFRTARDSLDGLHGARQHTISPIPQTPDYVMKKASEMEQVMEISRKEQDERDLAEAMELSKRTEQSARQDTTADDPQMIRALEESLKDGPHLAAQDRSVTWQQQGYGDGMEKLRTGDEPVGLRNIGNTCYLNSLLQVYYHLPEFRRAIMSFRPPEDFESKSEQDISYSPGQTRFQQPVPSEQPLDDRNDHERIERVIEAAQLKQSFEDFPTDEPPRVSEPPQDDQQQSPDENQQEFAAEDTKEDWRYSAATNAVHFVAELQKLFAAMALSNSTCVDPSGVARTMRSPNGDPIVIGAQQDAYEFNHLFLDIVEKGLKGPPAVEESVEVEAAKNSESQGQDSSFDGMDEAKESGNIVKDMFTLRFRQELCPDAQDGNTGERPKGTIRTGETSEIVVNATANEYRNLHSGLDDYAFARIEYEMSQSSEALAFALDPPVVGSVPFVDEKKSESSTSATKSVWFTRMPPVMVIYLQRITYNKDISQAEKMNEEYNFPCQISFDRYLDENKAESIRARTTVQRLRRERDHLDSMLKQYECFSSYRNETTKCNKVSIGAPTEMDIWESASPGARSSEPISRATNTDASSRICDGKTRAVEQNIFAAFNAVQSRLREGINASSELFAVDGLSREEIEESLDILTRVVQQDRSKYEALQSKTRALDEEEEEAYKGLERVKYQLHAVLVHDGGPSGGHYWTFIRNWNAKEDSHSWMKLSDSVVTHVSEQEMLSWSVGGRSRASAYCLIYAVESSLEGNYKNGGSLSEESRLLLPADRIDEVSRACDDFERQLQEQKMPDA